MPAWICQPCHLPPLARFAGALGAGEFLAGIFAVGFVDFAGGLAGFAGFPAPAFAGFGASRFAAFSFSGLSVCATLVAGFAALPRLGGRRPPPLPMCSARAASKGSA